jgi:hypothetical protein
MDLPALRRRIGERGESNRIISARRAKEHKRYDYYRKNYFLSLLRGE